MSKSVDNIPEKPYDGDTLRTREAILKYWREKKNETILRKPRPPFKRV